VSQQSSTTNGQRETLAERVLREEESYRNGEDRPLGSYAALMGLYGAAVVAGGCILHRRRAVPERIDAGDLALISVATHKLSRRVTKDSVTSPLRAGFTRYTGRSGPAELAEEVRGTGGRKAVGELLTCPFCIAQWIATGFVFGLALAPRATRMAASVLCAASAADFLQFAYATAEQHADRG
jgi:hypothetical protein